MADINVSVMNMEERGIYITLLSYCWLEGWLPNASTKLKRICNNPPNWKESWGNVRRCFFKNGDKLYHKRLDEERAKQLEWREKSREGGIKSGESRRKKKVKRKGGSKMVQPNGNSSTLQSSINNIICSEKHSELAIFMESKIKERLPRYRLIGNYIENWSNIFRLMIVKKEANETEIKELINWIYKHDFWYKNVLSADKFRKQFGKLWAEMKDENKKKSIESPEEFSKRTRKVLK